MRVAIRMSAVLMLAAIFGGTQVRAQEAWAVNSPYSCGAGATAKPVAPEYGVSVDQSPQGPGDGHVDGGRCLNDVCGPTGTIWGRVEYLLWWTKGDRLPPLVTTSPPG